MDKKSEFEEWRNSLVEYYNRICRFNYLGILSKKDILEFNLEKIPKCLLHFTRRICDCDNDCVSLSMRNVTFDPLCSLYDTENLYLHDKYIDCTFIDEKLYKEESIYKYFDKMSLYSQDKLFDGINDLCKGNENSYNEIQCAIYDIRFGCGNSTECYSFIFNRDTPTDCKYNNYFDMISEIERIMDFPFLFNYTPKNLTEGIQSKSIAKRSIEYNNGTNLQMGSKILLMGGVLLSFLFYYKNKKNSLTALVSILVLFSLAVYVFN